MRFETAQRLEKFFETFASEAEPVLLLDYDGTLAPFRVNRFEARPYSGVRELLHRIQQQGQTRMAVVSGRPAGEIGPMLQLKSSIEVWGLHGAERLFADGRRELEVPPEAAQIVLEGLRERLRTDSLGGVFEDKPNACVMHWRGCSPAKARSVERRTRQLFEPLAQMDGLGLLEFEAGLELRAGRDKGGAVEAILAESGARSAKRNPVAYLGDDLTDEAAFRVVNGLRQPHLSVLMRRERRVTDADLWLRPPDELREFLALWVRVIDERSAQMDAVNREELAAV